VRAVQPNRLSCAQAGQLHFIRTGQVADEKSFTVWLALQPADCGFGVIEAASADEALIVLQQLATRIDVVFSDIEMPDSVNAFGLSKWIRDNRPGRDVVLTGTVPRAVNVAHDLCESGSMPNRRIPRGARPYPPLARLPQECGKLNRARLARPALALLQYRLALARFSF
jgi:CheY-like chemotaxis protein